MDTILCLSYFLFFFARRGSEPATLLLLVAPNQHFSFVCARVSKASILKVLPTGGRLQSVAVC